ncbi:hypothetical protein BSLG_004546 [Batrachochytrium salamandrivorans]|nr:hypothetical protein BASA62_001662 [Batrachochytrium salamandrivorans]KAJ1340844.1 hypothetical protein BSLG_004546 [Batrachochytrium salamandrivorans]
MDQIQVEKATRALLAHVRKHKTDSLNKPTSGTKSTGFDIGGASNENLWVVIATKKMPEKLRIKPVAVPLPHPILPEDAEICLIVKDPQREYKDLIKNSGISRISRVIGISKLKAKFKPYEAKRQLCATYEMFLADERVLALLPPLLGKTFFEKKKHPAAVDLKKTNVKAEIERAINCTYLHLNKGVCNALKAGSVLLTAEQNVENIMAATKGAVEKLPGKWGNIQSVHIKTATSVALPVYNALHTCPADDGDDESDVEENVAETDVDTAAMDVDLKITKSSSKTASPKKVAKKAVKGAVKTAKSVKEELILKAAKEVTPATQPEKIKENTIVDLPVRSSKAKSGEKKKAAAVVEPVEEIKLLTESTNGTSSPAAAAADKASKAKTVSKTASKTASKAKSSKTKRVTKA